MVLLGVSRGRVRGWGGSRWGVLTVVVHACCGGLSGGVLVGEIVERRPRRDDDGLSAMKKSESLEVRVCEWQWNERAVRVSDVPCGVA